METLKKNNGYLINIKECDKMPYKYISIKVPGYYTYRNGRRVRVSGHRRKIKVWVPPKRRR
jgi:starvation-inducible outer membrane lipoprotein